MPRSWADGAAASSTAAAAPARSRRVRRRARDECGVVSAAAKPISRILSAVASALAGLGSGGTTIPLALPSLAGSSDLPGGFGRAVLERLPIWSCSVRGFACHRPYGRRGALLPHLFTLTRLRRERRRAVYFLCHWSVRLPCPGVTRRTAHVEFGLSSPAGTSRPALARRPAVAASSGRLAWLRHPLPCRLRDACPRAPSALFV